MASAAPAIDVTDLDRFTPLNELEAAQIEALLACARIERIPPGKRLFNQGDDERRSLFLLSGQIALLNSDKAASTLKAMTREAAAPILDQWPRPATALARTSVTVLSVDADRLAQLLGGGERSAAGPDPATRDDLDLEAILSSPLFSRLPGPHLQVLMGRMQVIEASADEVIVREGEDSAFFHIIESGRFRVTHATAPHRHQGVLGDLTPFDCFGEGALIANRPYDETVTTVEAGRLLRFSKGEFLTLIVRPHIRWIASQDLPVAPDESLVLLDVRSAKSYLRQHLDHSINLPLRVLQQTVHILDRSRRYIICCDNIRRSTAAAFLLARHGIETLILSETVHDAAGSRRHGAT